MGGKRINDRVRIIPPSKVNKHAGKDFEHFYEIVLSKYHAYNQIVVGSYQTSDMNLNPITKKRYEGLYYQRVKKALERQDWTRSEGRSEATAEAVYCISN